ncbi:MAG: ATP-binding protein [candidate division Zixibacteria bacterium]|nr:ATP-binding protein [candidate division Zixibacteria bacterium]
MEIYRFCFPSSLEYLDRVYDITSKILEDMPIDLMIKRRMLTAVSEAVTNSLVHGNKGDADKIVKLTFYQNDGYLQVDIDDQGKGFKPQATSLRESAKKLEERGRGIPIMKAYVDEVRFKYVKKRGMKVSLRKNLA